MRMILSFLASGWLVLSSAVSLAAEPANPATVVSRLGSNKENLRLAGLADLRWNAGADAEYARALDELLTAAAKRPVTESSIRALHALAQCPLPEATLKLEGALRVPDWRMALTAADALGDRRAASSASALRQAWDRPDARRSYGLRHAVVLALGDVGGPQATETLIGLLPRLEGQLRYEAAARLTLRTGQDHGIDPTAWADWWAAQGGRLPEIVRNPDEALPVELRGGQTLPKFFSRPIYAERVVFVLDRSKSMQSTLDGKPRLEVMQDEFRRAVERLPEATQFGLVAYNDRYDLWQPRLVPATSGNKSAAIQWLYSLPATGKTALFDAIEAGLSFEGGAEQVLLLTDGRPTAGKLTDAASILAAIHQINQWTRTRIDCFGIDTEGPPEELLKALAADNFGSYVRLR